MRFHKNEFSKDTKVMKKITSSQKKRQQKITQSSMTKNVNNEISISILLFLFSFDYVIFGSALCDSSPKCLKINFASSFTFKDLSKTFQWQCSTRSSSTPRILSLRRDEFFQVSREKIKIKLQALRIKKKKLKNHNWERTISIETFYEKTQNSERRQAKIMPNFKKRHSK